MKNIFNMTAKKIVNGATSVAAGIAGGALFFLVAFLLHWGGLNKEAQQVVTVPSATAQLTEAPAPAAGVMSPEQIFQKYADSTVQIVSTFPGQVSLFHSSQQQGIGSGFVVSADGYILTNAHVVTNGSQAVGTAVKASEVEVNFRNGKKAKAQIVGYDLTSSDVAVLKVDPGGLDLVPALLGDSDQTKVGEPVVAIGSPFGVYSNSLTAGVVSAVNRTVESPEAGFSINNAIQTDAAINRGNSGGPLFNSRGEVIGLNEQIATVSGGSEGVGFAVPINTAKKVMEQIINKGEVEYAYLGIVGQTVDENVAKRQGLSVDKGAFITEVQPDSPADKAGLKSGDVITAIDGQEMSSMESVTGYLIQKKPGDKVKVTYVRDGNSHDTEVELGKRPVRQ
jgi:serine protease Do